MRRTNLTIAVLAALLVPLGWEGCGKDYPGENIIVEPPEGNEYPAATSQDLLVGNFTRTYNERNYREYDNLLADGFVFYFAPDEIEELGQGVSYDRAQDTRSTWNMFSNQPGQTPAGDPVSPVQKLQLTLTPDDPGASWTDQVGPDFAGTTMKSYKVDMLVTYADGNREQITGLQEFYAVAVEVDDGDGSTTTVYQMKYWRDLGKTVTKAGARTDSVSWGALKARF